MLAVLEKVIGKRKERETSALDRYLELVDQLARGKEPAEDVIDEALAASGKSVEDLQADVKRKHDRLQAVETLKGKESSHVKFAAMNAKKDALQAEQKKAMEGFQQKWADLLDEERELKAKDGNPWRFEQAEKLLKETADPILKERIKSLRLKANEDREFAEKHAKWAEEATRASTDDRYPADQQEAAAERAEGYRQKESEARARIAEIEAQVAELEAQLMVP